MDERPSPARERPGRGIDWWQAALLLAGGSPLGRAAGLCGCAPAHLARRRRDDPRFRAWIEQARQDPEAAGHGGPAELRDALAGEMQRGSLRVLLWLGQRLAPLAPPGHAPEDPLDALLRGLSEAERAEYEALGRDDDEAAGSAP